MLTEGGGLRSDGDCDEDAGCMRRWACLLAVYWVVDDVGFDVDDEEDGVWDALVNHGRRGRPNLNIACVVVSWR